MTIYLDLSIQSVMEVSISQEFVMRGFTIDTIYYIVYSVYGFTVHITGRTHFNCSLLLKLHVYEVGLHTVRPVQRVYTLTMITIALVSTNEAHMRR